MQVQSPGGNSQGAVVSAQGQPHFPKAQSHFQSHWWMAVI